MPAILYNPHSNIRIDGLRLGIVYNMPDKALLSTARQFLSVIEQAAPDFRVFVSLFFLPGIVRSDTGKRHLLDNSYRCFPVWHRMQPCCISTASSAAVSKRSASACSIMRPPVMTN